MAKSDNFKVHGQIRDPDTGDPITGHVVRLFSALHDRERNYLGTARTAPDGRFTIKYRAIRLAREAIESFAKGGPALLLRVYDNRGKHLYTTEERSGKDRFADWDIVLLGQARDPGGRRLNQDFQKEVERFLKRPANLRRIARILAEEGGTPADAIYEALVKSDPFGISPFTFRTTICCFLNELFDDFKQTSLGQQLLFGGHTYKHLGTVSQVFGVPELVGFIQGPEIRGALIDEGVEGRTEIDEDFNFDVNPTTPMFPTVVQSIANSGRVPASELVALNDPTSEFFWRIHCEITPCDQTGTLRRFMAQVRGLAQQAKTQRLAGQPITPIQVAVQGELTFDGQHLTFPGHLEIHPVRDARVL